MFEKEAENYAEKKICQEYTDGCMGFYKCKEDCERYHNTQKYWQDGAEFGYKKGQSDQLVHKQYQLNQLRKANEWHYPSKGEYPKDEKKVLCILGDFENDNLEVGYYSQVEGDSKRWRFEHYDLPDDSEDGWGVSAWKVIVLPKEN